MLAKFDKDQYQIVLRQLDSLKQTASVLEYQTEFKKLAHGVFLYNPAIDDTFFMTRFVGGLREDIRSPILLHRPKDVDTASALSLIQEQELENMSGCGSSKGVSKSNKSYEIVKPGNQKLKTESEEKLATLKAFRRRNGFVSSAVKNGIQAISVHLMCHYMCWKSFWKPWRLMELLRRTVTWNCQLKSKKS